MASRYYFLIAFFLIAFCCSDQKYDSTAELNCNYFIDQNYEVVLTSEEVTLDLTRLTILAIANNEILFTDGTQVFEFNLKSKELKKITKIGKGPNEFLAIEALVQGNDIYFFDPQIFKIAKYNISNRVVEEETYLKDYVSGPLIFVESNSEGDIFYFLTERRLSKSQKTYKDLVKTNSSFSVFDTLFTYSNNSRLIYYDKEREYEFGFFVPLYRHQIVKANSDSFLVFDSKFFGNLNAPNFNNFSYSPDYKSYLSDFVNDVFERERDSKLMKVSFEKAIAKDHRAFESLYTDVLISDDLILYSLISTKSAFLLSRLEKPYLEHVLCSEKKLIPVGFSKGQIFLRSEKSPTTFEIIKYKLNRKQ